MGCCGRASAETYREALGNSALGETPAQRAYALDGRLDARRVQRPLRDGLANRRERHLRGRASVGQPVVNDE